MWGFLHIAFHLLHPCVHDVDHLHTAAVLNNDRLCCVVVVVVHVLCFVCVHVLCVYVKLFCCVHVEFPLLCSC